MLYNLNMTSHIIKKTIGDKLKKAIDNKGVTITKVANDLSLSRTMIYQYTTNAKAPSESNLNKIADYFDLPVEYFTDEPFDVEGNIIESFSNLLSTKLDSVKLNLYKNNAIKAINYSFNDLGDDEKRKLIFKLYNAIEETKNGDYLVDLTESEQDLVKLISLLNSLNINISKEKLIDTILQTNNSGIFKGSNFQVIFDTFDLWSKLLIPENYRDKTNKIIELEHIVNKAINNNHVFDNATLHSVNNVIYSLKSKNIYYSYTEIQKFLKYITFDNEAINSISSNLINIKSLYDLDGIYFDFIFDGLKALFNDNTKEFIENIVKINTILKDKIIENINNIYDFYQYNSENYNIPEKYKDHVQIGLGLLEENIKNDK